MVTSIRLVATSVQNQLRVLDSEVAINSGGYIRTDAPLLPFALDHEISQQRLSLMLCLKVPVFLAKR